MNPSLKLVSDKIKFFLEEIHKRFDEFDARMEQRFSRTMAAMEQRGTAIEPRIGGLKPSGAMELVMADNWGGLFDGGDDSIAAGSDAPVVADNWGGLFDEIHASLLESNPDTTDATSRENVPVETSPEATQRKFHELAQAVEEKQAAHQEAECSGFPVALAEQERRAAIVRAEELGASDWTALGAFPRIYIAADPSIDLVVSPRVSILENIRPGTPASSMEVENRLCDIRAATAEVRKEMFLSPSEPIFSKLFSFCVAPMPSPVSATEMERSPLSSPWIPAGASSTISLRPIFHHYNAPKSRLKLSVSEAPMFLAYAVATHIEAQSHLLNPYQVTARKLELEPRAWDAKAERGRSLFPTVVITYDSSLDDDPESGLAHHDAPHVRAIGRAGQALAAAAALRADAVGAAGGGHSEWVEAAGPAQSNYSAGCPAGGQCFPDDFDKDAESCMYTPTICLTQVLNTNNDYRTNRILQDLHHHAMPLFFVVTP